MRTIFKIAIILILLTMLWVSCGPSQSEKLYKEAVAKEYEAGMEKALPLYENIVDEYSDSREATKAREKIIFYKKEKQALEEKKRIEELERKRLEEEKRKLEEEKRRLEEERRREAEKLASYKLSESQAYNLVTNDCGHIRSRASFTISSRCDFAIQDVATFGEGKEKVAKILIYSKGFLYDITFTVYYGLIWNNEGDFLPKLLQVRKGRFTGLSDIAREFLKE